MATAEVVAALFAREGCDDLLVDAGLVGVAFSDLRSMGSCCCGTLVAGRVPAIGWLAARKETLSDLSLRSGSRIP